MRSDRATGRELETVFDRFMKVIHQYPGIPVRKREMKENFYHGMLLGLLKAEGNFIVKSNAESGIGYTDIMVVVPGEKAGCIIEVKYAENGAFDAACLEAMKQVENARTRKH